MRLPSSSAEEAAPHAPDPRTASPVRPGSDDRGHAGGTDPQGRESHSAEHLRIRMSRTLAHQRPHHHTAARG